MQAAPQLEANVKTILVDLLFYTGTRGGMESYVREVYSRAPAFSSELRFIGLASKELAEMGAPWFPGELIDSGISSRSSLRWALGELFLTARMASRLDADAIHCPANIGPAISRVPVVLTIQDLLSYRHPEYFTPFSGSILRKLIRAASRNAQRILTISSGSAGDINFFLKIPRPNITVVPLAGSSKSDSSRPLAKREGQEDIILSGGNRLPHKNFENLIKAIALIPEDGRPRLVITGGSAPDPLQKLVDELKMAAWVDLHGWISTSELDELYSTAKIYVFPTRFEGFGLPILESMSKGCPVICSDIPVLRDVAGEAATFVDTLSPPALAQEIQNLLADSSRLKKAQEKGFAQAQKFSWESTSEATVRVLLEVK